MASQPPEHHKCGPTGDGDSSPTMMRARLVERLRAEGGSVLRDATVARAMEVVPRHLFLPGVALDQAYDDVAVPTHFEDGMPVSSASQPAIVALMLQQLRPFAGMRVLEIGAGTGYNAALLAELAGPTGHVTTVDIDAEVAAEARAHLDAAGHHAVDVVTADGAEGWAPGAPYDRIELTVGASDIGPAWASQLSEEGLLVLPIWLGATDASVAFRKHGEAFESESLACCGFMRLRGAESDRRKWLTLAGGWRLATERAEQIAPAISTLLATRPRRRLWPRATNTIPSFAQYLALQGLDLVILWPSVKSSKQARPHQRFGLYAEGPDGPSLCLFGVLFPVVHIFGGGTAEPRLEAEWKNWQRVRMLPLEEWHVTASPRAIALATPAGGGVVRHLRRHYAFDIAYLAPFP